MQVSNRVYQNYELAIYNWSSPHCVTKALKINSILQLRSLHTAASCCLDVTNQANAVYTDPIIAHQWSRRLFPI